MIFQELHRIGQTFIVDPFTYLPTDLCPREEVIAPEKVTRLVDTTASDWEDYHTVGWAGGQYSGHYTLQRCWISWNADFTERISGVCYYALAENPELFWSLNDVYPDSAQSVYEWIAAHAASYFLATTPLLMYHGDSSDIVYCVNCGIDTVATPIHYGATLDQMLDAKAFSIGNGITLALAMERAGRWRSSAVTQALRRFLENGGGHGIGATATNIPPAFVNFYVQSPLSHIMHYPALYASCGPRTSGISVRRFLVEADGLVDAPGPYLQHVSNDFSICQVTSPVAAAFPYLRMSVGTAAAAARTVGTPQYMLFNPLPYYTGDLPALRAQMFLDNPMDDSDSDADSDADGDSDDSDSDDSDSDTDADQNLAAAPAAPAAQVAPAAPAAPAAQRPADFYVADIAGLMMSVVSQNSSWSWWNSGTNAQNLIIRFAHAGFATTADAMDYVARRLFTLHEANFRGRRGRLRAVLKTWMLTLDPVGDVFLSWFVKYSFIRNVRMKLHQIVFGSATAFGNPHAVSWNPPMPLTFMQDMFAHFGARFPLYTERNVSLMTNHYTPICSMFGVNGTPPGPDGPRVGDILDITERPDNTQKRYKFRICVCLYRVLKRYPRGTPEAQFVKDIDARVVGRLVGLKRKIAEAPDAYSVVGELVTDYWRRNRIELAAPGAPGAARAAPQGT